MISREYRSNTGTMRSRTVICTSDDAASPSRKAEMGIKDINDLFENMILEWIADWERGRLPSPLHSHVTLHASRALYVSVLKGPR